MANFSQNTIEQAGEYKLQTVEIISYRRHGGESTPYKMDIKPITINVELTEDIMSDALVGAITVYDTQDVRTVLPITGLEKLNLRFNTPGLPGVNGVEEEGFPFQIYKIDQVRVDENNPRGQLYKIYFCSQEAYYNSFNRISQAFAGPIEDAVEKIFRQKDFLNSKKKLYFEPTRTNAKVVIPNLRPFNAIKLLSDFAQSANYKNSGYLFYETAQGFFFRSIESMLAIGGAKARPSKFKYQYQVGNVRSGDTRDVLDDLRSVIKYDFLRPVDTLKQLRNGAYGNKLIRHDAFDKTFITTDFDYAESFGDFFHTEHADGDKATDKMTLPFAYFDETRKDISQNYMAKLMVTAQTSKLHNDYEFPLCNETKQLQVPQMQQLQGTNLKLLVHGNTLIHAGDVITFDLPLMRPLGDKQKRQESNPYFGGRYMIMSLKHVINIAAQRHEMILNCMKDAVRTPYPIEKDNNTVNTPELGISNIYTEDSNILSGDILERL